MPADLWNNPLVKPPFASDPPLKVNVPAKTYGLVLGILAVIGAVFALIVAIAAFTFTSIVNSNAICGSALYQGSAACQAVGHASIAGLGELIVLVAMILGAIGGFQMSQGKHQGRSLLAYSLLLALVGQLLYAILWGFGYYIPGFIISLIIYAVIYYFLVISRFPDEPPVVGGMTPVGYGPYGPPPQYPPQYPPSGPYPPQGPPPQQGV